MKHNETNRERNVKRKKNKPKEKCEFCEREKEKRSRETEEYIRVILSHPDRSKTSLA